MDCFNNVDSTTPFDLLYLDDTFKDKDGNSIKKDAFQFVYGSQLYGTLFGVFARMKSTKLSETEYRIDEIDLRLMNYQGTVNLGFISAYYDEGPDANDPSILQKNVFIGVQGNSTMCQKQVQFDKPLVVKKAERIIFNRVLVPLPGYHVSADIETRFPTNDSIPDGGLFDSEFYYRSGEAIYNRALLPGMEGFKSTQQTHGLAILFPSPRCHTSVVRILF